MNTAKTIFLSESQIESLIISACSVRPHTESDLNEIIRWADTILIDQMLLESVLDKKILVSWEDGEATFSENNEEEVAK